MIMGLPPQLVYGEGADRVLVELEQRDDDGATTVTLKVREGKKMRAIGAVILQEGDDVPSRLVAEADVAVTAYRRAERKRKKLLDV